MYSHIYKDIYLSRFLLTVLSSYCDTYIYMYAFVNNNNVINYKKKCIIINIYMY